MAEIKTKIFSYKEDCFGRFVKDFSTHITRPIKKRGQTSIAVAP